MEYENRTTGNSDVDTTIIIIAQQVDVAVHKRPDQMRFKLSLLEHLAVFLLNCEKPCFAQSACERNELEDATSVMQFMYRIKLRLGQLSKEEQCVVIATVAEKLAQEVFPRAIETYGAAFSVAR